jgi:hypothetical protein
MLGRLVAATTDGTLTVPADVEQGITHALRDHVEASIQRILPAGPHPVATARSLVLTALHRLVDPEGRRSRSLPRPEIEAVIAADGGTDAAARIVEALLGEGIRLLTVESDPDRGECLALSHDRLAEVIAELVEQRAGSTFDPALLELVVFMHRRVELHRHGDPAAIGRDDATLRPARRHARAAVGRLAAGVVGGVGGGDRAPAAGRGRRCRQGATTGRGRRAPRDTPTGGRATRPSSVGDGGGRRASRARLLAGVADPSAGRAGCGDAGALGRNP